MHLMKKLISHLASLFIFQSEFRKKESNRARTFRVEEIYRGIKDFHTVFQILMIIRILIFFIEPISMKSICTLLIFFLILQTWIYLHNVFLKKYPIIYEKKGKIKETYLEKIETFLGTSSFIIEVIIIMSSSIVLTSEELSYSYSLGLLFPLSTLLYIEALFFQPFEHNLIIYVTFNFINIFTLLFSNHTIKDIFYLFSPSIFIVMFCKLIINRISNLNLSIDHYIRNLKINHEILNVIENPILMISTKFDYFFKNYAFDKINNFIEYNEKNSILQSFRNDKNERLNEKINELLYNEKIGEVCQNFICQNSKESNSEMNTYMVNLTRKNFKTIHTTAVLVLIKNIGDEVRMKVIQKIIEFTTMMLYSLSHEIRNPINGIVGVLSFLKKKVSLEYARPIFHAISYTEFLTNQVKSVLDYAQIIKGEFALHYSFFNLRKLLKQIIKTGERWIIEKKGRIRIESNVSQKCPELILGDQDRIKQILLNLLLNSIKYTNEGFILFEIQKPNQFWI